MTNYYGIYFYNVVNGVVEDNSLSDNIRGIYLSYSSNTTITSNTMSNNIQYGIHLYHSPTNTIANNTISNNNICGIVLSYSSNTTITSNTMSNNNQYGINVDSSSSNTIASNNISNSRTGIFLGFDSSNTLTNNNLSHNSYGISIFSSSNTISDNTISGNSYGIYIISSHGNTIDHCDIFGNTVYGVYNEPSDPAYIADATNCWWGAPDGPSGVGSGAGDAVSTNVNYNPWLSEPWTYSIEYYVTIEPSSGGTTNPAAGGWYARGQVVPISATPSSNYLFSSWTTTGGVTVANSTSSSTAFTANGTGTIKANFLYNAPTVTLTFQSSAGGSTNPSGNNSYPEGTPIHIMASPLPGYIFSGWNISGNATVASASNATTTLTIYGPAIVTANFEAAPQYLVTIQSSSGGTVIPVGSNNYYANTVIDISATPSSGYQFANWTVVGSLVIASPTNALTTLTVNGPGTVTACFRLLDSTPPVISGLTPSAGSSLSSGAVSISAAFSDDTAIDTSSVALKIDGASVTTGLQVTSTSFTYSTTLQPGTHNIELTVRDTQGNPRTAAWAFTVVSPVAAFPMEYIAIGIVAVVVIVGVAFFMMKKKPSAPVAKPPSPAPATAVKTARSGSSSRPGSLSGDFWRIKSLS